jgi:hypothetical protein
VQRSWPLPTRIIDVGESPRDIVKVCSGTGISKRYCALSHRWGSSQPLCSTKAALLDRESGIAQELLPKTFQDAITITRCLSVRYLWIDSLCIYSYRTAMKHLGNLRFMPQFSEGFHFVSERKNLRSGLSGEKPVRPPSTPGPGLYAQLFRSDDQQLLNRFSAASRRDTLAPHLTYLASR